MTQPPAASSRALVRFFVAAFVVTFALQVPGVLALYGVIPGPAERFLPMAGLGVFGPTIAAMFASRREPGGVRGLFGQLRRWRVGAGWYVVALLLPGAVLTAGIAVYSLARGIDVGPWFYPPTEPQRIVAMIIIPFGEEIGWRGFAQPRLQERHGPLAASVILGVLWTLWHIPMLLGQGVPMSMLPSLFVYFCAGSVMFTWLYNRTGGSLPIAIVAHMGAHLNSAHKSLPGNTVPALTNTVGLVILAIALVVLDRKVWRAPAKRADA